MRGADFVLVLSIAVAFGLGGGDVLAKPEGPFMIASMAVRPDAIQFQAMALEWLRATATSTQFIFGAVVGVFFAEGGRFILRWLMRTVAFLNGTVQFIFRYRLMACAILAATTYAITHWVIA